MSLLPWDFLLEGMFKAQMVEFDFRNHFTRRSWLSNVTWDFFFETCVDVKFDGKALKMPCR
jgi:uncharacterized membrane protein YcfT